MPRVCSICSHPEREKIEKALVSRAAIAAISREYRVSEDALGRHKAHVGQAIVKAAAKHEERMGDTLLGDLQDLRRRTLELLEQAEQSGNVAAIVALIREARQNVSALSDLMEKAAGEGQADAEQDGLRATVTHIGEAPLQEWEKLPSEWLARLPGNLEGELYLVYPT